MASRSRDHAAARRCRPDSALFPADSVGSADAGDPGRSEDEAETEAGDGLKDDDGDNGGLVWADDVCIGKNGKGGAASRATPPRFQWMGPFSRETQRYASFAFRSRDWKCARTPLIGSIHSLVTTGARWAKHQWLLENGRSNSKNANRFIALANEQCALETSDRFHGSPFSWRLMVDCDRNKSRSGKPCALIGQKTCVSKMENWSPGKVLPLRLLFVRQP